MQFFRLANIFKGIVEFNGVWFVTLATQVCREKIDYLSPLFYGNDFKPACRNLVHLHDRLYLTTRCVWSIS